MVSKIRHMTVARLRQFTEMHAVIQLEPLGCRLALAEIYRGIVFEQ